MCNLPDNWNSYYSVCNVCKCRYHESGCEPCACERCGSCGEMFPPRHQGCDECLSCEEERLHPACVGCGARDSDGYVMGVTPDGDAWCEVCEGDSMIGGCRA